MGIFAKNLVIGAPKEEPKNAPPAENTWNSIHYKLEQLARQAEKERKRAEKTETEIKKNVLVKEKIEHKTHYEIVKDGDLEKHHNTKSGYLNDMTGFKNL